MGHQIHFLLKNPLEQFFFCAIVIMQHGVRHSRLFRYFGSFGQCKTFVQELCLGRLQYRLFRIIFLAHNNFNV